MKNGKIKLLLASSVFGDRGAEKLILNLYRKLPQDLYKIKIVCLRDNAPYARYLNKNSDISIDIIGMKNNVDVKALFKFYRYLREFRPHIVNFHHYRAALWGRPIARFAGIPVLLYSVHNKWGGSLHHLLDKAMSRFTDAIIPFSYAVRNYLITTEKIKERYIEIPIYAGIDIDRFSQTKEGEVAALKSELQIKECRNVLGYIGNINVEKGLEILIKSVKKLSYDFSDLTCLIIGEGPDEAYLKKMATDHGIQNHIKFLGHRHDIASLLKTMTVFVLPSFREGLPLVIAEAMASFCPVVATNIDGIPEIITNNKNGLLVPPNNEEELARAIKKLLTSPGLRKELSLKGYETATGTFSVSTMVEKYDRLYQQYFKRQK